MVETIAIARSRWQELLAVWCLDKTTIDQEFEPITKSYTESGRYYHNLDHILAMLAMVESLSERTENPDLVRLAVWFHDVIYDSRAKDNEERSAEAGLAFCSRLGVLQGSGLATLILATKTHESADADARVLLDADLAILGASDSEYQEYTRKIRREYAWVAEADYCKGRRQVLERFLTRPQIYYHLTHLEQPARDNLNREIQQLGQFT